MQKGLLGTCNAKYSNNVQGVNNFSYVLFDILDPKMDNSTCIGGTVAIGPY